MESNLPVAPRRLVRSRTDKWVAGVAGGMGEYFRVDATVMRLAFVALTILCGIGIPLYLLAWIIMPREGDLRSIGEEWLDRARYEPPAAPPAPNGN
ncbi:MAG TPA: PspC domain-containing protein [Actinomycetota bacterium]|nr:PspC domain-containing protein [Actinomycetota bacterium]